MEQKLGPTTRYLACSTKPLHMLLRVYEVSRRFNQPPISGQVTSTWNIYQITDNILETGIVSVANVIPGAETVECPYSARITSSIREQSGRLQ